jgi:hypothetical protein
MRPRSSFGQGSSGRGMARAIAKVAQVLLMRPRSLVPGKLELTSYAPFNARDLAPLILQRLC